MSFPTAFIIFSLSLVFSSLNVIYAYGVEGPFGREYLFCLVFFEGLGTVCYLSLHLRTFYVLFLLIFSFWDANYT